MWVLAVDCLFHAALIFNGEIVSANYQPYHFRMLMLGQAMDRFINKTGMKFQREPGIISWHMIAGKPRWSVFDVAGVVGNRTMNSSIADGGKSRKCNVVSTRVAGSSALIRQGQTFHLYSDYLSSAVLWRIDV